ncbi:hypothetical protein PR048_025653 [Dryococelus australis]|uniref:Uncharacterized protein n=1 Tax=Dryococelus australis TaxID=614101 RepID=A0ABQ9GJ65_9NEOP|nr:hypothetical protein PR048_025653 [Dryococelus australis]
MHGIRVWWGRGGLVVRLLTPQLDQPGSIPVGVAPGFSHVGIVPDDVSGRGVFSGISRFPRPFILALLHSDLASLLSSLKSPKFLHSTRPARLSANSGLSGKHLANPITAMYGATANEHTAEAPVVCKGLRSLVYRSLNSRNFPIPTNYRSSMNVQAQSSSPAVIASNQWVVDICMIVHTTVEPRVQASELRILQVTSSINC